LSLRNSNTSRDGGLRTHWLFRGALAALALVYLAACVHALDPRRMASQYMQENWGSERGFPGGKVSAIAQTSDGYLWIGTDKGLVRFDGLNFRVFSQAIPMSMPIGPVQALLTDSEGNLWVLLESTKILRYHDGKFELGREEAEYGVTAMGRRGDGTVLFSSVAYGMFAYNKGKFEVLQPRRGESDSGTNAATEPNDTLSSRLAWATSVASHHIAEPSSSVVSMVESSTGKMWLGTRDKGLFSVHDGQISPLADGRPSGELTCLLPMESGKLWVGTEKGLMVWNGASFSQSDVPSTLREAKVLAMIRDRDSNIWVGTTNGLLRYNDASFAEEVPATNGPVTALFEDREGNLWAGNPRGIERLRDTTFITYSVGGLQSESSGPIYVDDERRAWFAPFEGGLHWLKDGKSGTVTNDGLSRDVVYSIAGDKNELWIGRQLGGLTHLYYDNGQITTKTYTEADGLPQNGVYAVYRGEDGAVWVATLSEGIGEYKDGRFTTYSKTNGLASDTVTSIAESPDKTMWFGTPLGLSALSNGQWHTYTVRDGLPGDNVNCLFSDTDGVLWIGTASGLAFLRSGRVLAPDAEPASLREEIYGIQQDREGRLWIATSNHVLAAKRDGLLGGGSHPPDVREYGIEDGLQGVEGVKRQYSVFADTFGRIWFSMNRGLSVVDTSRVVVSSAPAIVQIEGLSWDGNPLELQKNLRIPAGGHRVTFSYAGLSLSVPDRVKFQYRLDGFDQHWSSPVSAREAVYTNLSAGAYQFRVKASNSDGLWNSPEAVLPFEIEPLFWQTWWFRLAAVVALAALIILIFHLRTVRLTRQMNMRFEERLAERTRIAQELHDTLLQGSMSASMQLHVAEEQLPDDSPAKPLVRRVLQLMGQVIEEGRNAVTGLRSGPHGSIDLGQAFSRVRQELTATEAPDFHVIVEGAARPLQPIIRDEIYAIGREALINSFRHSHASSIEVELEYAADKLRVLVRDNGVGIDPEVLDTGRDGHWGLVGMRERAKRIGAKLRVLSRAAAGTEVELSVPSNIAYVPGSSSAASKKNSFLSFKRNRTAPTSHTKED